MEEVTPPENIVFIVNPVSGYGRQNKIAGLIEKEAEGHGCRWSVLMTEYAGHAEVLARRAAESGADVVVAVGGDGTVNEVARGLAGTRAIMGIVPTGSGNGLANHLKLPSSFREAVRTILKGKTLTIDTGFLNGRLFVSLAGAGFDAVVAKRFARAGKRGFHTYARIAIHTYLQYRPRTFVIHADGVRYKRKGIFVSFANSNQFGNNISVDPDAQLNDGLLDVCIVGRIPFLTLLLLTPAVFLKQIHRTRFVEIIRAREITMTRKKGKWVHIDGEPWKAGKDIRVRVNPLSLHVIIP